MADNPKPASGGGSSPARAPRPDAGHIPITEELDSARWTLPPVTPIIIGLVAVLVIVAVIVFTVHSQAAARGSITRLVRVDQQGNTMVAVQVKLDNLLDKPMVLGDTHAELEGPDGQKYTDHFAPAVDIDRYVQAFPALADARAEPMREGLRIPPQSSLTVMTVFSFPLAQDQFDKKKSFVMNIDMKDRPGMKIRQ